MNEEVEHEPDYTEALKRLKRKSKEIKEKNIVPPVDEEEPAGRLSGGPENLDLEEKQ